MLSSGASGARERFRLRVLVDGLFCEPPPAVLLDALDEAGCLVVDDDLGLGTWWTDRVASGGDRMQDLAQAYLGHCVGAPVRGDFAGERIHGLLQRCVDYQVDGVVLLTPKFCEPALFDRPRIIRRLRAAGIPFAVVEFDEAMTGADEVRDQLEAFVESVLLWEDRP